MWQSCKVILIIINIVTIMKIVCLHYFVKQIFDTYVFLIFSNIKRHISSFHEGRRDFKCDRCEKMFSDKSSVAKHIKTGKTFLRSYLSYFLKHLSYSIHNYTLLFFFQFTMALKIKFVQHV